MRTRRPVFLVMLAAMMLSAVAGWLAFHKVERAELTSTRADYFKNVQRLYRHELLSMYQPPEEIFTSHGLAAFRNVQRLYSPYYLAYLAMGSTPVQPDVLYNPWFDAFILIQDSDGLIDNIVLASTLDQGETPQIQVRSGFWKEMYRRYSARRMVTFHAPRPFEGTALVIRELRNLTNHYHWPARVRLGNVTNHFDLYLQRPNQAIYATPLEPGTYVVFNVEADILRTNIFALPPTSADRMENLLKERAYQSGENGASHYNQLRNRP